MLNANQLLELMANDLGYDEASKGRIKSNYSKYSRRMEPYDARVFTSTKYLADDMLRLIRQVERLGKVS